jgi:ABC-2 type transport system ATP-binding protein
MAPTTSDPAIEATDLRKAYGSAVALDGVSLSISAGTVYGFLGPNGAGKTTTMRLLTGLSRPDSGSVRVCGVDVADRRALASHVGYLPETPPLYEEFSGREQLEYVADLRDLSGDVAAERIDRYLAQFDLAGDADKRISAYSKGMKQKTAFIQAVLHDPDVLFLDEPTAGLDPRAARRMRESMVEFADDGTTVFLSTHILPVVEAVADTVGVLFDGRVVAAGPTDSIRSRAEGEGGSLEDAFLAVTGGQDEDPPEDPADGDGPGSTESAARR